MTHDEAVRHLCWEVLSLVGKRKSDDLERLALAIAGPWPRKRQDWTAIEAEVLDVLRKPLVQKNADIPVPVAQPNSTEKHLILKAGMDLPSGVYMRSWPLVKEYGKYALNLVFDPTR